MKTYILGADVGADVTQLTFVKQDGGGGVEPNTSDVLRIGIANASKVAGEKVGVIVRGLVDYPNVDFAAYNFGDAVQLHTDGQLVKAGSAQQVGIAAETKTVSADDPGMIILVHMA